MYVPCLTLLVFTSHFHLVPNGGMALGAFLSLFASRRLLAEFRRPIVAHETDDTVVADADFMHKVYRHLGARFHGLMITQSQSAALRTLRFFSTFMARNHGLSILGGDMLNCMDMVMPSTNYDSGKKKEEKKEKKKSRIARRVYLNRHRHRKI